MQGRRDENVVIGKIISRRDNFHRNLIHEKPAIIVQEVIGIAELRVVLLNLEGKTGVIRQKHGNTRFQRRADDLLADRRDFLPHLLDFLIAPPYLAMMIQQPVPIFFRAEAAGAPAEKDDAVRAMRNPLIRPEPQFAGARRHADLFPAAGAGLLFHHPEILALQPAHGVMR
ncbi:hypothetical protein U14_05908 [Candidatus Moduliflexus flocculans]|uniref:Uncharacterized protein n=1 Tax=Candidatus Moduliflexus flocculans TaxID=1499966 RepID=A0A081BT90_9BACT|nr:hypothetical protein U14_05908 [Candidatus Moduliflexus flocculans]